MNSGLTDLTVNDIVVDPDTPATLYAGTPGGIFRSTDGASTWSAFNAGLTELSTVTSLAIDPQNPTTVYAGFAGAAGGVFAFEQLECSNAFLSRSKLSVARINNDSTPGNDQLSLSGSFVLGIGDSFSEIDPLTDGVRVVLKRQDGTTVLDAVLAANAYGGAGTRGWRLNGAQTSWKFTDRTGAPASGITSMKITDQSGRAPRQVQVQVKGKNGTYAVVEGDEPLNALVRLGDQGADPAGYCGEAAFTAGQCTFNGSGTTLKCEQ